MNKVSICVPCYNQVSYLTHTLNSIFEQDFHDYELIVSDDSTNDEVEKLVNEFSSKNNFPVKYFRHKPSLGPAANWNFCIKTASCDWIKILHHDDWFTNTDSLSQFMQKASEKNLFIFSSAVSYNVKNETKADHIPPTFFLNEIKINRSEFLLHNLLGPPSSILFNKKLSVFFDERMKWLVDVDFYIQILNKTNGNFVFIEKPLITSVNHADHNVTNSSNNAETELFEYFLLYKKLKDSSSINKNSKDRMRKLLAKYKIKSVEELKPYLRNLDFSASEFSELKKLDNWNNIYQKLKSIIKND